MTCINKYLNMVEKWWYLSLFPFKEYSIYPYRDLKKKKALLGIFLAFWFFIYSKKFTILVSLLLAQIRLLIYPFHRPNWYPLIQKREYLTYVSSFWSSSLINYSLRSWATTPQFFLKFFFIHLWSNIHYFSDLNLWV